jgi:polysaccharide export outer membrane protein
MPGRFTFPRLIVLSALTVTLLASVLAGRLTAQAPSATDEPGQGSADYHIGPGDLLGIGVSGLHQFTRSVRVSNTGKIHLPYVGVIHTADLTSAELEAMIARLLRDKGLVRDPWVTVRIEQYRAQPVYILGEVIQPGQFVIKDEMYIIDLITLAGGFNEVATPVGFLYRRQNSNAGVPEGEAQPDEAIEIDFNALNEGTRPDLNMRLRGGDVLYVPQRRKDYFFVVGDVVRPGAFELRSDEPAVLTSQAVSRAGGPGRTAKATNAVLVRRAPDGGRLEIPLDLKAVFQGKQPEHLVQANDIIFVPGSTAKTLYYGLLGTIPGVVESAGR